ncbi:hypothetical protein [Adlercreutzia aquisgranensis]|uniref:hypothetical protein n=1 Tax=Adlercreutzia aquisgranensis TaxID=2941323 RepID=UPI00203F1704|nr:hypothetical protein [Adlercreutzia aquisgranensis]
MAVFAVGCLTIGFAAGCFMVEISGFASPPPLFRMQNRRNQPEGHAKPEISTTANAETEKSAKTKTGGALGL